MIASTPDRAPRYFSLLRAMISNLALLTPRLFLQAVVPGAVSAACGIGLLGTSGWLITRAALRPPVFVLSIAIGSVQAFALGRGIARYVQRLAVHDLSLRVLGKLRLQLFDTLEPLIPGGLETHGSGDVVSGFIADAELVAEGFSKTITATVDVSASIFLGVLIAFLIEPVTGAALLIGAFGVVVVALACSRIGRAGAAHEAEARSDLAGSVIETMRCAPELIAYGREDIVMQQLEEARRRSTSAALRRALGTGLGRAATTWIAGGTLLAVVAVSLGTLHSHRLSGVMLAVVTMVSLAVLDQCANLPFVLADADAGVQAARHLDQLGTLTPPVREPRSDCSSHVALGTALLDEADLTANGVAILEGVSLQISARRRVALVGRSGSGKTSALHALLHFVECSSGRAAIGGIDVRHMTRSDIAQHVGWMGEETHVFALSLGDNLRLGQPSASDDECIAALDRVGLETWFVALPVGLDTMFGAGGRPLSAGERQRLGMARAIVAGGSVLLLDEPTAHIDPSSKGRVLSELMGAAGQRSILVVSHEPDIDRFVDEVVILEGGRVVSPSSQLDPAEPPRNPKSRSTSPFRGLS